MGRRLALAVVLASCGRIGFEAPAADSSSSSPAGDGAIGDGAAIDGPATACAGAIPAELGVRVAIDTCTGEDRISACGAPGTREVVLSFVAPQSRTYVFRLHDPGTNNVSSSTAVADAACATASGCSGVTGIPFTAGTTTYFVAEVSGGGCGPLEFLISENF